MTRLRSFAPMLFPAVLLAVAWACLVFTGRSSGVAGLWPVNALALAFMMRWARNRQERGYVLAMAAAVMLSAHLISRHDLLVSSVMSLLGVLEIGVSAYLLRRCSDPLASLKAFTIFVAGAVVAAPAMSGALAALVLMVRGHEEPLRMFLRWTIANGLGMVIFGSFLLSVGRLTPVKDSRVWIWFALAQAAVLVVAAQILVFSSRPALFLLFPVMAVAAMTHRQIGGATAVAITSMVAIYGAVVGRGTFIVAGMADADPAMVMQVLLAALVFTVLPVSALFRRLDFYAAELDRRRVEAEELSAVKTRLLAHVSHEIRSPMAGVTTLAELLRDGAMGELTARQRETMAQIASSGADVAELARDLTDAASLQSGEARVHLAEVDVGEAIQSAVDVARFRTSQHGARIQMVPGGAETLLVIADPLRLRQILVNLLVNGAKYGGSPPLVRISARIKGRMIRFEVSDNGPGVDKKRRAHLFKDFQRLGAEKTDLDGSGLGLALSQQIARLQNGGLGVEDGDLGGARFWLELPMKQPKMAAA